MIKIFSNLKWSPLRTDISFVNRQFLELSKDPAVNQNAVLSNCSHRSMLKYLQRHADHLKDLTIIDPALKGLLNSIEKLKFDRLQKLSLEYYQDYLQRFFDAIAEKQIFPNLIELHLNAHDIDFKSLKKMSETRPEILRTLKISIKSEKEFKFEDLELFSNLERIHFEFWNHHPQFRGINKSLTSLKNLRELKIGSISTDSSKTDLINIFSECNWEKLNTLELGGFDHFDDDCFNSLLKAAPNLESLSLQVYKQLTLQNISAENGIFTRMKFFRPNYSICRMKEFPKIWKIFPNIEVIDCDRLEPPEANPDWVEIFRACPNLTFALKDKVFIHSKASIRELQEKHKRWGVDWNFSKFVVVDID